MPDRHRTNRIPWPFVALLLSMATISVCTYAALVKRERVALWGGSWGAIEVSCADYKVCPALFKTVFAPIEWLDMNYIRPGYWSETEP